CTVRTFQESVAAMRLRARSREVCGIPGLGQGSPCREWKARRRGAPPSALPPQIPLAFLTNFLRRITLRGRIVPGPSCCDVGITELAGIDRPIGVAERRRFRGPIVIRAYGHQAAAPPHRLRV